MLVKVCGARSRADVQLLASAGVDLIGLWHGVPGGHAELDLATFVELSRAALEAGVQPVLVTFLNDPARIAATVTEAGVRWIQLHAYQPPSTVRALKAALPEAVVLKVLHVRDGACLEARFAGAYARGGTDLFLLDTVTGDGRVGSTGQSLDTAVVLDVAGLLDRRFLLAGGIRAELGPDLLTIATHPSFHGVDVDSGARQPGGALCAATVTAICRAWRAAAPVPPAPGRA